MYVPRGAITIVTEEATLPSGAFVEHIAYKYRSHLVDIVRRNRDDSDFIVAVDERYARMTADEVEGFVENNT